MALAEDLLSLSLYLADLPEDLGQAALRRAVSTAYYALFHLLISEATLNWRQVELRPALGRIFEHRKMKSASEKKVSELNEYFKKNPPGGAELAGARNLHTVANAFIQAQQKRNDADYDTSKEWSRVDVLTQIASVAAAFESWKAIREEPNAQAYLVSLLGKTER